MKTVEGSVGQGVDRGQVDPFMGHLCDKDHRLLGKLWLLLGHTSYFTHLGWVMPTTHTEMGCVKCGGKRRRSHPCAANL